MSFKKEISDKLNTLLQNNINSVEGYEKAASNTKSVELKAFFRNRIEQRSNFVDELRKEILRYGQIPEDDTSFSADLHRAWIDIKAFFSSDDEKIILEECIRGDEKALEDYQELLQQKDLPPTLDTIFVNQKNEILSAINKDKMYLQSSCV
ncbi:PA2169 family four-helix-bundle protein [Aquimarina sp. W85]|uniref:ferritin-like domain-containing protein n=1 Tax=Aquimarina rhodophyticola TaxID=3342246 RepID=UPI0036719F0E